jgi:prolipoprotein diacylglyceryltransferase
MNRPEKQEFPPGRNRFLYRKQRILRFFVEGLRTDSLMLGSLRMAQLTSIAFIIAGVIGIVYVCLKGREVELS